MKCHLPLIIFLFAVVTVHLLLFAHLSDAASQSINDLYEKWTSDYMMIWINGMGIVKNYIYISDNDFNLVRVAVNKFSIIGKGKEVKASLDLSGAEVFSFKRQALDYKSADLLEPPERNPLTVFFVPGYQGDSVFKKDSLCFAMIRKEVPSPYGAYIPVKLTVLSLDEHFSKRVYSSRITSLSNSPDQLRLLSAGKYPVVWYDLLGMVLHTTSFKAGPDEGDVNIEPFLENGFHDLEYGSAKITKGFDLRPLGKFEWKSYSMTGGLYLADSKKMLLHTKNHTVNVLDVDGNNIPIPYSQFFIVPPPLPPSLDSTTTPATAERDTTLLIISVGVGLAALFIFSLLFCCVCCRCSKGKVRASEQSRQWSTLKFGRRNVLKKGGRGGGSRSSSNNNSSNAVEDDFVSSFMADSSSISAAVAASKTQVGPGSRNHAGKRNQKPWSR